MNGLSFGQAVVMVVVALLLVAGAGHGFFRCHQIVFSSRHPRSNLSLCDRHLHLGLHVATGSTIQGLPFLCLGICTHSHRRVVCVPRADYGAVFARVTTGRGGTLHLVQRPMSR